MEKKKSVQANLEKSKSTFILIGLIMAISIIVYAFSWESPKDFIVVDNSDQIIEEDITKIIRSDLEKKDVKVNKPAPKK